MLDSKLIEALVEILGPARVIQEPSEIEVYSTDALTPSRAFGVESLLQNTADVVVKPRSTYEVSAIVKIAANHKVPLVPFGGGTGVMGGVIPIHGGMVVDLQGLNRVLEVNVKDSTVQVEAGIFLADLSTALDQQGLMLGHDPWSVPIATVGGAISTNGVGYRATAHGPMGDQLLGLEAVLPSGEILTTRSVPKYSSGPNLNHLFIGAEGVFGIITRATLRVFRQPEERLFSTFTFQSFGQGFEAVAELLRIGLRPTMVDLTEDSAGIRLYMVFEGYTDLVTSQLKQSSHVCHSLGGTDIGPSETINYWDSRYSIAVNYRNQVTGLSRQERWQRWHDHSDYLHVALPLSRVLDYRNRCDIIFGQYDIRVLEYSIWTSSELYSMFLSPGPSTNQLDMHKAVDEALMLAQDMGGIMEYCHGVGIKLTHLLPREMGAGINVIRTIKKALDPYNIMNPGKLGI